MNPTANTSTGLLGQQNPGSDLVNNVVLTNSNTGTANSPATDALGTYNIIPSAASGTGLGNYTINYINGTLTVKYTINYVWTGAADTKWNNTANWTPSAIPTAIDSVTITKTGTNTLSIDVSPTIAYLSISSGNTVSLNGQTLTVNGNWLNAGTFNGNTGANVFGWATTLSGTGSNNFNNVTINSGSTLTASATAINVAGNWTNNGTFSPSTGTVNFDGTAAQTISRAGGETFNNLTVSNTAAKVSANNNLTVGTSALVTVSSGAILDMGSNQLLGGAVLTTSGTGTLNTQNTTATAIPTGRNWAFAINYNNATGSQSIANGTYAALSINNTSGIDTAIGTVTINGALTVNSGATLDMRTFTLTAGTGFSNVGLGTIKTQGSFPSNKTWTGSVVFNSLTVFYTIQAGTYNNLDIDGGTGVARNMDAGSGTGSGTFTINGNLTWSGTGSVVFNKTTVNFAGNNQSIPILNFYNLWFTGSDVTKPPIFTSIAVSSTFNPGIFTGITSGTISFIVPSGGGVAQPGQTIPAFNYYNLTISGARTVNVALASSGTIGVAGTFTNSSSYTGSSLVTTGSTINYNGTGAQTIIAFNYNNLSISGARTSNNITLASSGNVAIAGNFNYTATFTTGTLVNTNSTILFNGTTNQAFNATGGIALNKLTLNNTTSGGGTISLNGALTLASTVTLTAGKLDVVSSNVSINSGVTISTPTASSYFVTSGTGRLIRKSVSTATFFPVGTATSYAPVTITNNTASDMTVGVSPTIINAVWDSSKLVKLQWSIASSATTTTSSILHQFNGTDDASNFVVGSTCENGWFNFGYNVTNVSTPISLGGNAYTLNKTGLAFTAGTTYLSVMGNEGSIKSLYVHNNKKNSNNYNALAYNAVPYKHTLRQE